MSSSKSIFFYPLIVKQPYSITTQNPNMMKKKQNECPIIFLYPSIHSKQTHLFRNMTEMNNVPFYSHLSCILCYHSDPTTLSKMKYIFSTITLPPPLCLFLSSVGFRYYDAFCNQFLNSISSNEKL